jgi:hypothetical protein
MKSTALEIQLTPIGALFCLTMTLCVLTGFTIYSFFFVGPYWLGGMDGYFYGLIIKSYLNQPALLALDMESPLNYPPYFFYFIAFLGRILGIESLGFLQGISFAVAYASLVGFGYILLRYNAPRHYADLRAGLAIAAAILISIFSTGGIHIWQKPHAIASLLAFPALLVYLSNILAESSSPAWHRALAGAIFAFAFGAYTPFVIIPALAVAIVAFWIVATAPRGERPWPRVFDKHFFFPATLLSLPYVSTLLYTVFTADNGIGVVIWFLRQDLEYSFLSLKLENLAYLISGGVGVIFIGRALCRGFMSTESFTSAGVFVGLSTILSVAIFSYIVSGFDRGEYFTAPFKYYIFIPALFGFALPYCLPDNFYERVTEKVIGSAILRLLLTGLLGALTALAVLRALESYPQIRLSQELSTARARNIEPLLLWIERERAKGYRLVRYLANGEARFADYAVRGPFVSHITFNHSYSSMYEEIDVRASRLQTAVRANQAKALHDVLVSERIDLLMLVLEPAAAQGADYIIDYAFNNPPDIGVRKEVRIPQALLHDLVASGALAQDRVGPYMMYRVIKDRSPSI